MRSQCAPVDVAAARTAPRRKPGAYITAGSSISAVSLRSPTREAAAALPDPAYSHPARLLRG